VKQPIAVWRGCPADDVRWGGWRRRAGAERIAPAGFALSGTMDKLLAARGVNELRFIDEVISRLSNRVVISPWMPGDIKGVEPLWYLLNYQDHGMQRRS